MSMLLEKHFISENVFFLEDEKEMPYNPISTHCLKSIIFNVDLRITNLGACFLLSGWI